MSNQNSNNESSKLSLTSKIGFVLIVLVLAGAGLYLGLRLSDTPLIKRAGARFEDLPEEMQQKISGLAGAVKAKPKDLAIRSRFCHTLMESKLLIDAEDCYTKILKIDGSSADAYTHLGEIAFYNGKFDESISRYERAIGLDPEFAHAYFNLGYAKMEGTKDYVGAREAFDKYLELEENSPIKNQVNYLILRINDTLGDRPGVPTENKELVINPNNLQMKLK
jgi:tetratricopeptide (TPR) repeat protein